VVVEIGRGADYIDAQVHDVPMRIVYQNYHRYQTNDDQLIILKLPDDLNRHVAFFERLSPKTIVEFGIFEGGSSVLWPRILGAKYCGIDLRPENTKIRNWISKFGMTDRVSLNFGVSQSDENEVQRICSTFFGDAPIDVVIDDASHIYEHSRRTFEIAFPMLRPGGVYLLEDWSWSHANHESFQGAQGQWKDQRSLTNLVFEIVMLLGSRPEMIERMEIYNTYALIFKSQGCNVKSLSFDDAILNQQRIFTPM
jgi:predicted O-methyltransferase YrrM